MAKHTKKQRTGKYQPFRNHIYFVPFMLICGFFMLWLTLLSFADKEYRNLGLFIPLTVLCFVMSKLLSDPLRITVIPSDAGLTVTSIKNLLYILNHGILLGMDILHPILKGTVF